MRLDPEATWKVWHADVEADTLATFKALLPIEGARIWTVQTALEKFLARAEVEPELVTWVHQDIAALLVEHGTPKRTEPINLRLPMNLTARYVRLFPERGNATWFIRRTLDTFVDILEMDGFDLEHIVERAVNSAVALRKP